MLQDGLLIIGFQQEE